MRRYVTEREDLDRIRVVVACTDELSREPWLKQAGLAVRRAIAMTAINAVWPQQKGQVKP